MGEMALNAATTLQNDVFNSLCVRSAKGSVVKGRTLVKSLVDAGLQKTDARLEAFFNLLENEGGSGAELLFDDFIRVIAPNEVGFFVFLTFLDFDLQGTNSAISGARLPNLFQTPS